MSSARGQANHELYLAKILLASWRRALAEQDIPAVTLGQAFLPAVREHLLAAYGWFLLSLAGIQPLPPRPPARCAELPALAEGKALPGEIREFQRLESEGWMARLQAEPGRMAAASGPANLATAHNDLPGPELVAQWAEHLAAVFDRMSDSLDEY
jgi:hypothetical protein